MDARELQRHLAGGAGAHTAADEVLQLLERGRINLPVLVALALDAAGYADDEVEAAVNRQRFQIQADNTLEKMVADR